MYVKRDVCYCTEYSLTKPQGLSKRGVCANTGESVIRRTGAATLLVWNQKQEPQLKWNTRDMYTGRAFNSGN